MLGWAQQENRKEDRGTAENVNLLHNTISQKINKSFQLSQGTKDHTNCSDDL